MKEPTEPQSIAEKKRETEPDYLIDIRETPDGATEVTARFSEMFLNAPTLEQPGFDPDDDDLAEVDTATLEEWARNDSDAEYQKAMADCMKNAATLKEQADTLATALSTAQIGLSFPAEAREVLPPLRAFLARATEGTPATYATLPPETKRLVEYVDRLNQLVHLYIGSTYTSPLGALYSPAETADIIEDFFIGAETGLSSALSTNRKSYRVHLERPPRPDFINAASNLMYHVVTALDADPLTIINGALRGALHTSTQPYRNT